MLNLLNEKPFGKQWVANKLKLSKPEILNLIEGEKSISTFLSSSKIELVNRLRNEYIVKEFNKHNIVGSVVMWRSAVGEPYKLITVKQEAFISNGQAVVFFEGRPAYCSIDPLFIQ